jgi:hypothetical protein
MKIVMKSNELEAMGLELQKGLRERELSNSTVTHVGRSYLIRLN